MALGAEQVLFYFIIINQKSNLAESSKCHISVVTVVEAP